MNNYTTAKRPLRMDEVSWILQQKIEGNQLAEEKVEVQAGIPPRIEAASKEEGFEK